MPPETICEVLPTALTIYEARELKARLQLLGLDARDWLLDASGVERVDLAGLQVLLLAQREQARKGHTLALYQPSAAITDALSLLGLADAFEPAH